MPTLPGLDPTYLAARRRPRASVDDISARIRTHLDDHDGYLAFSGGKDSLVALDLALRVEPNLPVVFFDSGLEYPETYEYLHHMQDHWDLQLHVMRPVTPLCRSWLPPACGTTPHKPPPLRICTPC